MLCDFTTDWLSQRSGCHRNLVITEFWSSQELGCHRGLFVTEVMHEAGHRSREGPVRSVRAAKA